MNVVLAAPPVTRRSCPLSQESHLPKRSRFLCWGAERYLLHGFGVRSGFLARHFNAIRLSRAAKCDIDATRPLVFYLNHPSWWDPLTAFAIARHLVPERYPCAPIDRRALRRYPLLDRLGLFGVDSSASGTKAFLQTAVAVASHPATSLWFTPEGRFTDARDRPLRFRPGIGHLAHRIEGLFIPIAIDYRFWNERLPEILVRVGVPIDTASESLCADEWTARFENALTVALDRLAVDAASRDDSKFQTILSGVNGVAPGYDAVRRVIALTTGRRYEPRHSNS